MPYSVFADSVRAGVSDVIMNMRDVELLRLYSVGSYRLSAVRLEIALPFAQPAGSNFTQASVNLRLL